MLKFKIANRNDIPELSKLLTILFSQDIEFTPNDELQRNGLNLIIDNPMMGNVYVLFLNNKIIGMVCILNSISTALGQPVGILEDMIIHPDYQNSGYGKKLINFAINHASENGLKRITLLTDFDNNRAIKFYNKIGFSKSAMIPLRKLI